MNLSDFFLSFLSWQPNRKGWRKYHSSLPTYLFFLELFGASGTAPSSLDSFTQLVINSSNFYARFLSFSREYDASGKRFREAEGEASPQSPPAGALLLKKKEKLTNFSRDFPKMQQFGENPKIAHLIFVLEMRTFNFRFEKHLISFSRTFNFPFNFHRGRSPRADL